MSPCLIISLQHFQVPWALRVWPNRLIMRFTHLLLEAGPSWSFSTSCSTPLCRSRIWTSCCPRTASSSSPTRTQCLIHPSRRYCTRKPRTTRWPSLRRVWVFIVLGSFWYHWAWYLRSLSWYTCALGPRLVIWPAHPVKPYWRVCLDCWWNTSWTWSIYWFDCIWLFTWFDLSYIICLFEVANT